MPFRYRCFLTFSTLPASALVITHLALTRRAQAEQERPFGRYTTRQVVALTEPLARLVAPEADGLSLSAERIITPRPVGGPLALWSVDGEDRSGEFVVHFDWDADTGELSMVGHRIHETAGSARPLSRQEAIQAAWYWLRDLGIAEKAPQWRPVPAPKQKYEVLTVFWQAEGRGAAIQIGLRSCLLHSARSWRTNGTASKVAQ